MSTTWSGGPVQPGLTWHDHDLPKVFHPSGTILELEPCSAFKVIPPTPIPLGGPTATEPTPDDAPDGMVYAGQRITVGDQKFWVWQIVTVQQLCFGRYRFWLPLAVGCLPARVIPET